MFPVYCVKDEPFAKFASRWDLLPGRVVIPGSAGVPPAQDLAGSWRLASQGWSVHLPTGAGAAPLQECGRDARAPRGKPMAGQVQIRILQKTRMFPVCTANHSPLEGESQKPSRQAKADAVGGGSRSARLRAAGIHKTPDAAAPGLPLSCRAASAFSQRREPGASRSTAPQPDLRASG